MDSAEILKGRLGGGAFTPLRCWSLLKKESLVCRVRWVLWYLVRAVAPIFGRVGRLYGYVGVDGWGWCAWLRVASQFPCARYPSFLKALVEYHNSTKLKYNLIGLDKQLLHH